MIDRTRCDIACMDVLEWARTYDGPKFHALLCDPPYELGFMGKGWDAQGVAFDPATWAALAEHLHPGGFIMAFASSRGWHRLACAIEDAGLRIHPSIFGWAFGSGFPKATRIDTQIDKAAGAEREVVGYSNPADPSSSSRFDGSGGYNGTGRTREPLTITAPATPLAAAWEGHRYGGQALKPALEPIIVAQKPYAGRPVDSITATGAGALWIDGARVPTGTPIAAHHGTNGAAGHTMGKRNEYTLGDSGSIFQSAGRWPPNLVISHLPPTPCPCAAYTPDAAPLAGCRACGGTGTVPGCERVGTRRVRGRDVETGATCENEHVCYSDNIGGRSTTTTTEAVAEYRCAPGCPVSRLDEAVGPLAAGGFPARRNVSGYSGGLDQGDTPHGAVKTDAGGPSRFFPTPDWSLDIAEALAAADPVLYCAKASRRERNSGLDEWPEAQVRRHSGGEFAHNSGSTVSSKNGAMARNIHPCCKPLMLTRWLASLLLPPAAYAPRRILVPFAGSGSEMIGAMLAGWEEVIGIEAEAEYVDIARARLAWWAANRDKAPEVRAGTGTGQASYLPNGKNAVYGNGMGGGGNKNPYPRTNGHAPAAPPMLPGLELEAAR